MREPLFIFSKVKFNPRITIEDIKQKLLEGNESIDDPYFVRIIEVEEEKERLAFLVRDNLTLEEDYIEVTPQGEIIITYSEIGEKIILKMFSEEFNIQKDDIG